MAACVRIIVWLLVVFLSGSSFAKGPYGTIHVGQWRGGGYTDDDTGKFSHCAASTILGTGSTLSIGKDAQGAWLIALANPAWDVGSEHPYAIDLTFDGNSQYKVAANPIPSVHMISGALPEGAVTSFRTAHYVVASGFNGPAQLQLSSAPKLMAAIARCAERLKEHGIAGAGDFSIRAVSSESAPQQQQTPPKLIHVTGTGFVVSGNGHVVTNDHVISGCVGDIQGNRVGEPAEKLRVVSRDETNDLALLEAAGKYDTFANIKLSAVHSGDPITVIGFPFHGLLTSDFTVTSGIVSSLAGILNDTRFLQISAPVQPGNSGGPLLDSTGAVVGVVTAKLNALRVAKLTGNLPENINFAVKTGALRDFLDNSVVNYHTSDVRTEMKTAEVAAAARAYTMLISCSAKEEPPAKSK